MAEPVRRGYSLGRITAEWEARGLEPREVFLGPEEKMETREVGTVEAVVCAFDEEGKPVECALAGERGVQRVSYGSLPESLRKKLE